jgi:hypothetical protein
MPEEVSDELLGKATEQSAVLSQFRRVPVGRAQVRFPVLSALPVAYWVAGDTGLKQTTEVNWTNKFLNIEEIATIMPVPDNVIADVDDEHLGPGDAAARRRRGADPGLGGVLRHERPVVVPDEHQRRGHLGGEQQHGGQRGDRRRVLR